MARPRRSLLSLGSAGRVPPGVGDVAVRVVWVRAAEITDALVDLLIGLIHKVNMRADRRVERELTEDLRRVRGKESILFQLAEAAVDHASTIRTRPFGPRCIRW